MRKSLFTKTFITLLLKGSPVGDTQRVDIHEKLAESENLMKEMSQTWEEKLVKTGRN